MGEGACKVVADLGNQFGLRLAGLYRLVRCVHAVQDIQCRTVLLARLLAPAAELNPVLRPPLPISGSGVEHLGIPAGRIACLAPCCTPARNGAAGLMGKQRRDIPTVLPTGLLPGSCDSEIARWRAADQRPRQCRTPMGGARVQGLGYHRYLYGVDVEHYSGFIVQCQQDPDVSV